MELREYWVIVWKRKLVVLLCVLVLFIGGFVYSFILKKPEYLVMAQVLVEQPHRVVLMMSEHSSQIPSPLSVETQDKILTCELVVGDSTAALID